MTYLELYTRLLQDTPGMTAPALANAAGHSIKNGGREVSRLVSAGKLFSIKASPRPRYFASVEQMEAMRSQVEADEAAYMVQRRCDDLARQARHNARRYEAVRAARLALPPKPRKLRSDLGSTKKPPKPIKLAQPKPIPAKKALHNWKNGEAIIPDHVKVQHIPHRDDTRFRVVGEFVGAITGQRRAA